MEKVKRGLGERGRKKAEREDNNGNGNGNGSGKRDGKQEQEMELEGQLKREGKRSEGTMRTRWKERVMRVGEGMGR